MPAERWIEHGAQGRKQQRSGDGGGGEGSAGAAAEPERDGGERRPDASWRPGRGPPRPAAAEAWGPRGPQGRAAAAGDAPAEGVPAPQGHQDHGFQSGGGGGGDARRG